MTFYIDYYLVYDEEEWGGSEKRIFLSKELAEEYVQKSDLAREIQIFRLPFLSKVYLVLNEDYFGGRDKKLFATYKEAQAYIDTLTNPYLRYEIQRFEANPAFEKVLEIFVAKKIPKMVALEIYKRFCQYFIL